MKIPQLLWRIPLGAGGGLIALYAFPTENIWILAPLIPAVILLASLGLGFWSAALVGFIASQAFYISHIEWISLYLGPVPLIALSTLQSFFFALAVGATAWLYKKWKPKKNALLLFAVAAASIWTAREYLANNFPYGGFPWSRLAMTQPESFMNQWVFFGGLSLLTFMLALIGSILAIWFLHRKGRNAIRRVPAFAVIGAIVLVPVITMFLNNPIETSTKVIAAVQGNANAGLFSNLDRGTILQNHLDATELVFDSDLSDRVDLLVWPENSSDVDPLRSVAAAQKIDEIAIRIGAPFSFGTITSRGGENFNSTLLWRPEIGAVDYYDKKQPVPFAEFVPNREFWRLFAPDLIDLVPEGFSFGVRDGIYEIEDDFVAGTLICFEIAEDGILRDLVAGGAEVILSQTNNADFGYSDETYQQAGIAQLRAIETGRSVVNISTVGLSAIYLPTGEVLSELVWYEPGAMVEEVPLYSGTTPAMIIGPWFDYVNSIAVFGMLAIFYLRKKHR
ncbi:MAG: apolipoprotein N-acyltransferase [Aquiluna sp.]|nr:apolipoprotein N-acyltransferase [Aquiluna sp.]